ncbi:MAG: isochorismatase family cysteine hydrolase [Patescibacteria group bacterium]|nr:isochorismatase family cysteine hydrolase [Patescibacteria group bacterium]
MSKLALGVIDMQGDFAFKDGKLYVKGGEEIIKPTEKLVEAAREADIKRFFSGDQHNNPTPEFEDWGEHCVAGTSGAQLIIQPKPGEIIVAKGDSQFSAFAPRTHIGDESYLHNLLRYDVDTIILVGLAYDFCVGQTALSAAMLYTNVLIVTQCTRSVELPEKDYGTTILRMKSLLRGHRNIRHIKPHEAMRMIKGE